MGKIAKSMIFCIVLNLVFTVAVQAEEPVSVNLLTDSYNLSNSWVMANAAYFGAVTPEYLANEDGREALRFWGNDSGFESNNKDFSSGAMYTARLQQAWISQKDIAAQDYIRIRFFAKAVSEQGNSCKIRVLAQTVTEKNQSGSKIVAATAEELTNQWKQYSYTLRAPALGATDTGIRIVLELGYYKQITYISDFELLNYGSTNPDAVTPVVPEEPEEPEEPEDPDKPTVDGTIVFTDSTEPGMTLLAQGNDCFNPFGVNYYNLAEVKDITDEDAPVRSAFHINSKSYTDSEMINRFGIRTKNDALFQIPENNTYVVAAFWVKSNMEPGSTEEYPKILPQLQYCTAVDTTVTGGKFVDAVYGVGSAMTLNSEVWYKCTGIYQVTSLAENDLFRFVINCGSLMQDTYIGGFCSYGFSPNFSYNGKTKLEAVQSYITNFGLTGLEFNQQPIDGFDAAVTGYTFRANTENGKSDSITIKRNPFADIQTSGTVTAGTVLNLKISNYGCEKLHQQVDVLSQQEYSLYFAKNDSIKIMDIALTDTADNPLQGLQAGENKIHVTLNNASEAQSVQLIAVLYDKSENRLQDYSVCPVSLTQGQTVVKQVSLLVPEIGQYDAQVMLVENCENYFPRSDAVLVRGVANQQETEIKSDFTELHAVQNLLTGQVNVTGDLASTVPLRYSVVAVDHAASDSLGFIATKQSRFDGTFALQFVPQNSATSGRYTCSVCDEKSGKVMQTEFDWYDAKTVTEALLWFQSASAAEVAAALQSETALVGSVVQAGVLFGTQLQDYLALSDRSPVNQALAGQSFKDVQTLYNKFGASLLQQKICQSFAAANEKEWNALVLQYQTDVGFMVSGDYGYLALSEAQKNAVYQQMSGRRFADTQVLSKSFHQAVAMQLFDHSAWGNIEGALEHYKAILDIDLTSNGYQSLSSEQRVTLYKTLANADYKKVEDIKNLFDNTVSELSKKADQGSVSGGSGSGKGGGSGFSVLDSVFDSTPTDTEDTVFSDLESVSWAKDYILDLHKKGIVQGDGTGRFYPENLLTRAEFIKMIVTALHLYDKAAISQFTDCTDDKWYSSYAASAANVGIVFGKEDGSFGGEDKISRQDMAVIVFRSLLICGKSLEGVKGSVSFSDGGQISNYAADAVDKMVQNKIMNGVGENRFAPQEASTRAMAAKVVSAMLALQ